MDRPLQQIRTLPTTASSVLIPCLASAETLCSAGSTLNARPLDAVETIRSRTVRRCQAKTLMRKSGKMLFAFCSRIRSTVLPAALLLLGGLLVCLGSIAAEPNLSTPPPPASRRVDFVKGEDKRNHWAFKPPVRPPVPEVKNRKWARNPIDHFVLARLEKEGLKPSPEADRVTLIRRLSLDLIGLPPTPKEVDGFV